MSHRPATCWAGSGVNNRTEIAPAALMNARAGDPACT